MKQGLIIPVYRHGKTACIVADKLSVMGLPIILIDDGNDAETKIMLESFCAEKKDFTLITIEKNRGKGAALAKGFDKAKEMGLTHVLQIDADGQHDDSRVVFFLEESVRYPDKIICGYPEFDESAPRSRVNGRKISNFWGAIVALSGELKDMLCGFRVYPVDVSARIMKNPFVDKRMGFDPEILVRLYWKKVYPVFHPIKVIYPQDGISNFRAVRDNIRISWTFTRLCTGMLLRLPLLIINKIIRRKDKT